jgi:hypothetical protein
MFERDGNWMRVLLVFAVAGCGAPPDFDATPIMKPVPNTDAIAGEYAAWEPTPEQLQALEKACVQCKGNLKRLLDCPKWSGERLRVTGIKGGLPVTESIGTWHIAVIPTADPAVVELKGLLFARGISVKLDLNRDVLIVNGAEFKGTPISGKSPGFKNTAYKGVKFERGPGLATGRASILILDDQRVVMDFDKVIVNGARAREYGELKPAMPNK